MKFKTYLLFKNKTYLFSFMVVMLASILCPHRGYSQVDYYYGQHKRGLSIGIGGGVSILNAHYRDNPLSGVGLVKVDYDFTQYISVGVEGQMGQLLGQDVVPNRQYFPFSLDNYSSVSLGVRVSVGAIKDYPTSTALQDVIKKIYLGVGGGVVMTHISLGDYRLSTNKGSYSTPQMDKTCFVIPINIGTNINLPGILGADKLELNPNYQFNYSRDQYLDGIGPADQYTKHDYTGYSLISLTLKYKF
ncbi:hypothetical protein BDD43_2970 [Mucilaginibacter gracilis]|uniref:Outer membrane protein with beta-barrel domain n=1 Tax=Mucilaginibacter gracilis TaxID=423350 RepID=A0A495J1U9_9SPHI|nr:hypothetical protein [Mucilaginibacter gracilis]RKR82277.1 hypothetical protein BDD43_2453 [Mucilaginibacter gracilis]RKR82783.1 hypothetical protein BDD43_2970 [Mucilaginibacter gracilis]